MYNDIFRSVIYNFSHLEAMPLLINNNDKLIKFYKSNSFMKISRKLQRFAPGCGSNVFPGVLEVELPLAVLEL